MQIKVQPWQDKLFEPYRYKIIHGGRGSGKSYGVALLVAFVDDGQELIKPLNHERIHKVISLQIFDRYQVTIDDEDICDDIYDEHFGNPEIYTIGKQYRNTMSEEHYFKVHHSRCFLFGGKNLASTAKINNKGWDGSVLQACYNAVRNYAIVNNSSVEIIQDFVQPVMKLSGLDDKISSDQMGAIIKRLEVIDRSRSSQNTIMLDSESGEDYSKLPSNVSGLSELWEQFSETICATTGIPASRLFGRSPSGLNASGESDMKNWHDIVNSYREDQVDPCLTWLIKIIEKQQNWKTKPDDFSWTFPLLDNPSEAELADIRKKYAEIDAIYIDRGGISASNAWQERFGSGQFQRDIQLAEVEVEDESGDTNSYSK